MESALPRAAMPEPDGGSRPRELRGSWVSSGGRAEAWRGSPWEAARRRAAAQTPQVLATAARGRCGGRAASQSGAVGARQAQPPGDAGRREMDVAEMVRFLRRRLDEQGRVIASLRAELSRRAPPARAETAAGR
ncbi:unnamed protein product [Prorocentrum cordatum]|uniref:Uncharacterized protein n=1 Tax=Prorocentrum cordatum TaxID=2364126 RepID=A0ABN9SXY0_9DINO|nr:unnamed protein product [Polarella glacialis]